MRDNREIKNPNGTVLVVDDASIMRLTCQRALEGAGFNVIAAESGESALKLLEDQSAEVAVLDIRMPGISGVEVLREIKSRWPITEVLMMTAYADAEVARESLNLGATALLIKPFESIKILVDAVNKSMTRVHLRKGKVPEDGPFFEVILRHGKVVHEEQLKEARARAQKEGFTLRQAIIEMNILSDDDLDWAVANYLDIPYVRLNSKMIDSDLIRKFPAHLAHTYTCLPLFSSGNELHLVTGNPFNNRAILAIEKAMEITPVLSMGYEPEIRELINSLYGPPPKMELSKLVAKLQKDSTNNREQLFKDLMSRVQFEEVKDIQIHSSGPDLFDFQISVQIRALPNK